MSKPITIRGVTYESHTAAAIALQVGVTSISRAKADGNLDGVGLGRSRRSPCTINGKNFESRADAARHFRVTTGAIHGYLIVCAAAGRQP